MIKYIIFDLGEVLLNAIRDSGRKLIDLYNVDCSAVASSHTFVYYGISHPLLVPAIQDFVIGEITEDEYIAKVLEAYPVLHACPDLKQYIRDNFTEITGTRDIIVKLKSLGYSLGLLSTHTKEWIEYCEQKFDFCTLFDAVAFSYKDKVTKPDPCAFDFILKRLEAVPGESLFIDDTVANVNAAEVLGMKGIAFTSADELGIMLARLLPDYNK
jgi:HAD superfamily hydrolase (TIGR01509 family)